MHSFVLLTLVTSAFAVPLLKEVNAPVKINAPTAGVAGILPNVVASVKAPAANVAAKKDNVADGVLSGNNGLGVRQNGAMNNYLGYREVANLPVKAAVKAIAPLARVAIGNVGMKDSKIAKNVLSGNKVSARDNGLDLPTLPVVIGSAQANATKIISNIQSLLASTPVGSALVGPLNELNSVLTAATNQLGLLAPLGVVRGSGQAVSTQQASQAVAGLTKSVSDVIQQVTSQLGTEVPELQSVFTLLNGSINGLLSTVTSLVPGIATTLAPLLGPVSSTLNSLGLGLGLSTVGL
ncbi:hypothetical protein K439DRAFT_1631365 [Ramaria rubella]|nr:hypothetical protein K439DRAFT_1631365 [Ramaria rubella]